MTLIKSISGIRGTVGTNDGENLSPMNMVKFAAAYGTWIKEKHPDNTKVVIGRDARLSGEMLAHLLTGTLQSVGIDVVDLGLATTPTVEMAVVAENAAGGVILSASHNPKHWNALKLLNEKGEFISAADGRRVLIITEDDAYCFADVNNLGSYTTNTTYLQQHIEHILALDLVDVAAIKNRNFKVLVDGVNSVGGFAVPALLRALGVDDIVEVHCEPTGNFAHNPEPLPENLGTTANELKRVGADIGIVVDPDVDRLAFITETGDMFGEEYTLVAVADYVLQHRKGCTVSNLSSTKALKEITEKHGCNYHASAVGEVNVVRTMKAVDAVIGGEGNGGIIVPELHYGRDALAGIALFLSHLALSGKSCSLLRAQYPTYYIAKNKIELTPDIDVDMILERLQQKYKNQEVIAIDGVKIHFDADWVHLRKSNTEPIIRIYAESATRSTADAMVRQVQNDIANFLKND